MYYHKSKRCNWMDVIPAMTAMTLRGHVELCTVKLSMGRHQHGVCRKYCTHGRVNASASCGRTIRERIVWDIARNGRVPAVERFHETYFRITARETLRSERAMWTSRRSLGGGPTGVPSERLGGR